MGGGEVITRGKSDACASKDDAMHRLVVIRLPECRFEFFDQRKRERVSLLGPVQCHAGSISIDFVKDMFVTSFVCHGDLQRLGEQYSRSQSHLRRTGAALFGQRLGA